MEISSTIAEILLLFTSDPIICLTISAEASIAILFILSGEFFLRSDISFSVFLTSSFSFNSSYKNEIIINNRSKNYFINFAFSPPIDKSVKVEIFDLTKKKRYKINFIKQNIFYTYFDNIFKILKKNKYNFFYKEILKIAKIKKKIF